MGEVGDEKPEIRYEADTFVMVVHSEGTEITNVKVSNYHAERNGAVGVVRGGSGEVRDAACAGRCESARTPRCC